MLLLEAVNIVLAGTGESRITVLDALHPQQAQIVALIEKTSKRLQSRGWWFNKYDQKWPFGTDVTRPTRTAVPAANITFVPKLRADYWIKRAGFVYDLQAQDFLSNTVVEVNAIELIAFEELPDTFADFVAATAAFSFTSDFEPDSGRLTTLRGEIQMAQITMMADHIRNSRVNLFTAGSTGYSLARSHGQRYGRRI